MGYYLTEKGEKYLGWAAIGGLLLILSTLILIGVVYEPQSTNTITCEKED